MGSSLILQGGSATQNSIKERLTQNTHNFTVGDAIRYDTGLGQWVVPSGKYLVFAHSDTSGNAASASTSGLAWKEINASDVGLYRTATNDFPPAQIIGTNGWVNISKSNGTAQLINEQDADTVTGGHRQASGCVYQGGVGWGVTVQVTGYAIRIA